MAYLTLTTSSQLKECIDQLAGKTELAVDLEFDKNRYRYGFNLCLMQIFDGENCFLIDPLSNDLDISLIFPVLENPGIQKIVFSFGEDLRLLHSMGCFPRNMYDISVATSLLNFPPASLTNLLADILNVDVGKSSQQSNWFKRPLSEKQLNYAAEDVMYLPALKKEVDQQAQKVGISVWIAQENKAFEEEDHSNVNHNEFLKEKDKGDFSEYEWYLFSRLMEFRDDAAKKLNRPGYHVIEKQYLKEVAENPERIRDWKSINGIHKKLKKNGFPEKALTTLKSAIDEAEQANISKTNKAYKSLSKKEYQERRREQRAFNQAKKDVFKPLQKALAEEYGKHAQIFMLSNRDAGELFSGDKRLLPYQKNLFEEVAKKYDIPLGKFLN